MKAVLLTWEVDTEYKKITRDINIVSVPKADSNLSFITGSLGCDMIDVVAVNGFDIFVDDEGLLKSDNVVASYYQDGEKITDLAGNLLVSAGIDAEGETVWFQDDAYPLMMNAIKILESANFLGVTR